MWFFLRQVNHDWVSFCDHQVLERLQEEEQEGYDPGRLTGTSAIFSGKRTTKSRRAASGVDCSPGGSGRCRSLCHSGLALLLSSGDGGENSSHYLRYIAKLNKGCYINVLHTSLDEAFLTLSQRMTHIVNVSAIGAEKELV